MTRLTATARRLWAWIVDEPCTRWANDTDDMPAASDADTNPPADPWAGEKETP